MELYEEYKMADKNVKLPVVTHDRVKVLGEDSRFIPVIEKSLEVVINENSDSLSVSGLEINVNDTIKLITEMNRLVKVSPDIAFDELSINKAIEFIKHGNQNIFKFLQGAPIYKNPFTGEKYYQKSDKQRDYLNRIYNNDIVFGIGEAGTSKTFLAVIAALNMLSRGDVEHIVITRPAVEASKHSIGMLPGTLYEKMSAYLAQIIADIEELTSKTYLEEAISSNKIEVLNVGLARGRSFKNSIVIIDEAQNLDYKEFELLLTRIGEGTTMVFIGDNYQSDIGTKSAFNTVENLVKPVDGVSVIHFGTDDIVRSSMASKMVEVFKNNR